MAVSAGCSIVSTRANGTMRNIATRRLACSLAYGGSANATSYCPGCSCSTNFIASTRWIVVRSSTFRVLMLARRALSASRCSSTNSAVAAPRDSASSPRAPVQIDHAGTPHRALQDAEPRFAHAVPRRPRLGAGGRLEAAVLELPSDDLDHPRAFPFLPNAECGTRNAEWQ